MAVHANLDLIFAAILALGSGGLGHVSEALQQEITLADGTGGAGGTSAGPIVELGVYLVMIVMGAVGIVAMVFQDYRHGPSDAVPGNPG